METCDLNDVMRAIGNLEGQLGGMSKTLDDHSTKLDTIQAIQNQSLGRQGLAGGIVGFVTGIIGAWISSSFLK